MAVYGWGAKSWENLTCLHGSGIKSIITKRGVSRIFERVSGSQGSLGFQVSGLGFPETPRPWASVSSSFFVIPIWEWVLYSSNYGF